MSAVLSVVMGNVISSFVLLPLMLTLLESGKPTKPGASRPATLGVLPTTSVPLKRGARRC